MKAVGRYHLTVTPQYLLRLRDEDIVHAVTSKATAEEIREHLRADIAAGVEAYPIGECDNWNTVTQECEGHPIE